MTALDNGLFQLGLHKHAAATTLSRRTFKKPQSASSFVERSSLPSGLPDMPHPTLQQCTGCTNSAKDDRVGFFPSFEPPLSKSLD